MENGGNVGKEQGGLDSFVVCMIPEGKDLFSVFLYHLT
jgi:hypothetical protein